MSAFGLGSVKSGAFTTPLMSVISGITAKPTEVVALIVANAAVIVASASMVGGGLPNLMSLTVASIRRSLEQSVTYAYVKQVV